MHMATIDLTITDTSATEQAALLHGIAAALSPKTDSPSVSETKDAGPSYADKIAKPASYSDGYNDAIDHAKDLLLSEMGTLVRTYQEQGGEAVRALVRQAAEDAKVL